MSKCLNRQETGATDVVEIKVSKDVTILENIVHRLAEELGITLENTSGISYASALAGRKDSIELGYHRDFDGYECFATENGTVSVRIANVAGEYLFNANNSGKKLLEKACQNTENPVEKKIDLAILLMELQNKLVPDEICDRIVVTLTESELNLITATTILKYLC